MATQAFAQTAASDTGDVEAVVVTGTRTTGLRAVDSAAPVQSLGADILKRTGSVDLAHSLAQQVPSLQALSFGSDSQAFNQTYRLYGLSPNQALVLVDGKRRHNTANVNVSGGPFSGGAAPDISYIPISSVDHVEVLQDGAAAQYGTDAIAGVVNIILKKNHSGGNLSATAGQYEDGGGLNTDISGNLGLEPIDKAYLNLSFESHFHGNSFRGDVDPRIVQTTASGAALVKAYPGILSFPGYPYVNYIAGDGMLQQTVGTLTAGYEVSPALKLYMDGSAGYKLGRAYENYRPPNVALYNGVPAYPGGFSPQENFREQDFGITLGAKGAVGDSTYDLSSTYGRNFDGSYVIGTLNNTLYANTGASPHNFHDGNFIATQWTNNLDLTHSFNLGMPERLVLAAGAEFRIDSYQLQAGDLYSYTLSGAASFFGYGPSNAGYHQRSNYSFYADAALTPIKGLKLDGAVRYEDYTDFGNTTVFKGTARYDFNDAIALRGTASTGFRAPTLEEEFYSGINVGPTSVSGVFAPNSPGATFLGVGGLKPEKSTNYSVGLVTHFLPRLTMTLDGYAIKITDRIVQSGNFYGYNGNPNVVVSPSVISALKASGVPIDPAILASAAGTVAIQTFVNGADTQTYGMDYVATYPLDLGADGHMDLSLSGNYNSTNITRVAKPPSNVAQSVVLLDQNARSFIEDSSPKFSLTFSDYYTLGKWSFNLRETFYGASYIYEQDPVLPQYDKNEIKPAVITDLDISYQLPHGIKVSAGANNLFDVYPTKKSSLFRQGQFNTNNSAYASSMYPSNFSSFGFNGGAYYGKIVWSF
jgi:iron complex outermembrane receptor protein